MSNHQSKGWAEEGMSTGRTKPERLREVALSWSSREEGTKKDKVINKPNKCTEGASKTDTGTCP